MSNCTSDYTYIFGHPGVGAHFHLGGFAIVDIILTIFAAILITAIYSIPLWKTLGGLSILAIFSHWFFCVPTSFNQLIGIAY